MGRLRDLAEATPPERVRHVDLLRAAAILAVVTGHWLAAVVIHDGDVLTHMNALEVLGWAHPITWLLQVMPLFFIVGGYANAASMRSHRARGGDATSWLLNRSQRLVTPVTVLLVVLSGAGLLAALLGADTRQLGIMAHGAVLPLWFLVAYLAVVVLTPPMHALHRRYGFAVPVVLVGVVVAGDAVRLGTGIEWAASANFVLLWLAVHQAGFAWQDGSLPSRAPVAGPIAGVGLGVLVLTTLVGPYPVSMINVPGAQMHNVSPPSVALLALATTQLGLALLLSRAGERWMRRTRPWAVVIGINTVTFTLFLWHMPALVLAAFTLHALKALPHLPVDSVAWLAWQVPWLLILAVVLAGLVAVFARVERGGDPRTGISGRLGDLLVRAGDGPGRGGVIGILTVASLGAAISGMLLIADGSPTDHGPVPLPTAGLLAWLAAAVVLWLLRSARAAATARQR